MADPYWRYPSAERDPRAAFSSHLPSDGSSGISNHMWSASDPRGTSDFLRSDKLPIHSGGYGSDDIAGIGTHRTAGLGSLAAGATVGGYTPLEDLVLAKRDALDIKPDVDIPNPLIKSDGPSADQSNILFVDGLPTDCTRREVAHLFRPFIGFKDIRVVHKEPRRTGDKAHVLCFVEFNDSKCALTALEALQGG
ncbi:RNA-binding protein 2 isoform X2 [Elaeis guineensis]|uniref:RNA-binding protein 2 isoform X2 n=1 Tax=Elaeis guineensis var. tenera TaxID=51953 RepID=UPI003C6D7581